MSVAFNRQVTGACPTVEDQCSTSSSSSSRRSFRDGKWRWENKAETFSPFISYSYYGFHLTWNGQTSGLVRRNKGKSNSISLLSRCANERENCMATTTNNKHSVMCWTLCRVARDIRTASLPSWPNEPLSSAFVPQRSRQRTTCQRLPKT